MTQAEKGAGPLQTDPQVHSHLSGTEKDFGSNANEVVKEAGLLEMGLQPHLNLHETKRDMGSRH